MFPKEIDMISPQEAAKITTAQKIKQAKEQADKEAQDRQIYQAEYERCLAFKRRRLDRDIREQAEKGLNSTSFVLSDYKPARDAANTVIAELRKQGYTIDWGKARYSEDTPEEDQVIIKWGQQA